MKKYVRIPISNDVYKKLVKHKKELEKDLGFEVTWDQFFKLLFTGIKISKLAADEIVREYKEASGKHRAS